MKKSPFPVFVVRCILIGVLTFPSIFGNGHTFEETVMTSLFSLDIVLLLFYDCLRLVLILRILASAIDFKFVSEALVLPLLLCNVKVLFLGFAREGVCERRLWRNLFK